MILACTHEELKERGIVARVWTFAGDWARDRTGATWKWAKLSNRWIRFATSKVPAEIERALADDERDGCDG